MQLLPGPSPGGASPGQPDKWPAPFARWSPVSPPEPQHLNCRPKVGAVPPGGAVDTGGSSQRRSAPWQAGCVGKSSPLTPRPQQGRDLPKVTSVGSGPGSAGDPTRGCRLWLQGPCGPDLKPRVCSAAWLQHTKPSWLTKGTASWSQGHSAVPAQRGWGPSHGSYRRLEDSLAGPGCWRTPPRPGRRVESSWSQQHRLRLSRMRAASPAGSPAARPWRGR